MVDECFAASVTKGIEHMKELVLCTKVLGPFVGQWHYRHIKQNQFEKDKMDPF